MNPLDALRAAQQRPVADAPAPSRPRPRVLVAGAGGALGAAVLEAVLASPSLGPVRVLVTQAVHVALRGLGTLDEATLDRAPPGGHADLGVVVFDRERHANGREAAWFRPAPDALVALARRMHAAGVRDLLLVMPHATATLPEALKRGLATFDEHAVAAAGFERVLIVRPASAAAHVRAEHAAQRLADWVLAQLHLMVPAREKPVRPAEVARVVAALAAALPAATAGTRVVGPETVWEAAQAADAGPFAERLLGAGPPTPGPG